MPFPHLNAQPKLNSPQVLVATVVGGVSLVPFVLATPHHVSAAVVKRVDQPLPTIEEVATADEEIVKPPFLADDPKRPAAF